MNSASTVEAAKTALERGEYNECLIFLENYLQHHQLTNKEEGEIKLLMVTALMGKGQEELAVETCKSLAKSNDEKTRENAKQLISILEAPSLPRPSNWSIQIPNIKSNPSFQKEFTQKLHKLKKIKRKKIEHPPTGETKDLEIGFLIILLSIIVVFAYNFS